MVFAGPRRKTAAGISGGHAGFVGLIEKLSIQPDSVVMITIVPAEPPRPNSFHQLLNFGIQFTCVDVPADHAPLFVDQNHGRQGQNTKLVR